MRYIDDFALIDRRLDMEKKHLISIVGEIMAEKVPPNKELSDIEGAKLFMKKRIQDMLKLGLIKNTDNTAFYEVGDETLMAPVYAHCLAIEIRTKNRMQKKVQELIRQNTTLREIREEKRRVMRIGVEVKDYSLTCKLSAVIRKAFANELLMEEIISLFQSFFKNVNKDFQYVFDLKRISFVDCIPYYCSCAIQERVAFLFFAHRFANELTVYAWQIIEPVFFMLLDQKKSNLKYEVNKDYFCPFHQFSTLVGAVASDHTISHELDGHIEKIMKKYQFDDKEKNVFIHACYYIANLEKDLIDVLEPELDVEKTEKEIGVKEPSKEKLLKAENKQLNDQLRFMQERCEHLQTTINNLVVEHQITTNKQQKEYKQLTKKYEECMEELELYRELEQEGKMTTSKAPQVDLKNKRIVIIGGHDRWHQLIKSMYPDWILINDEKPLDINMFRADGIFFFTKYMSHSLYRKYISQCRCHNIPFFYLTSLNLKSVEKQIRETLRAA